MDQLPRFEGDEEQLRAIARGLYTVARVDGVQQEEVAFISDLLQHRSLGALAFGTPLSPPRDGAAPTPTLASLERLPPVEPPALAALLEAPALRELFVRAAYLLAWADGKVSFGERAAIDAFASALGIGSETLARFEAEVKDQLVSKNGPAA